MVVRESDPRSQLHLPPGFRFYPTDEELLVQYLCRKVSGHHFSLQIIGEIDLYKFDPWVLPNKALFGEKEWYFFSPRDRKYPNGSRPNRVAGTGYWKATGTDKIITMEGRKVGIKKALVFYVGKAPKGTKTNWIMHEYRLSEPSKKNGSKRLDDWVLCRIYEKKSTAQNPASDTGGPSSLPSPASQYDDFFNLPALGSLKNFDLDEEEDQKLMINLPHQFGGPSSFFDYSSSMAEFDSEIVQPQYMNGISGNAIVSSIVEEEVQSGKRGNGNQMLNGLAHRFSGSFDPFYAQY